MRRKLLCYLLTACCMFSLVACGDTASSNQEVTDNKQQDQEVVLEIPTDSGDGLTDVPSDDVPNDNAPAPIEEVEDYIEWEISDDMKVLTISGKGPLTYDDLEGARAYQDYIEIIEIKEGITSISTTPYTENLNFFTDCSWDRNTSIKEIILPSTLNLIGEYAFQCLNGLEKINIPGSVTTISQRAFRWCTNLTTVNFAEGLTEIEMEAFIGCTSLTDIEFPKSLKVLGACAFISSPLDVLHLVPGMSVGRTALPDSLTSVYIPADVTMGEPIINYSFTEVYYGGTLKDWIGQGQTDNEHIHYEYTE